MGCTIIASNNNTNSHPITNSDSQQFQSSISAEEPTVKTISNLLTYDETVGLETITPSTQQRDDAGNPYIAPDLSPLLNRPYKIGTWSWTNSSGTDLIGFHILKSWLSQEVIDVVLSKYRYFAADFKVRIQVQSTMMHYGKIAVAVLPCTRDGSPPAINLSDLFALDVHLIDASRPETLEIDVPFIHPLKWWAMADYDTTPSQMNLGPYLYVKVLAGLGNAQATTASVPISIFVNATNVRLAAPVPASYECPNTPSMFSSPTLDALAELRAKEAELQNTISTKQYILPSKNQSASYGTSPLRGRKVVRYAIDSVPQYVSIRPTAPLMQSLEDDTTIRMGLKSDTMMDDSPEMVQAMLPDESNVLNVCKRPYLLDTIQITQTSLGQIWSAPVSPAHVAGNPTTIRSAVNAQVVTRMATYWHGSMKYVFSFTASHVTTLRIACLISYQPTTTDPSVISDQVAAVWDVTGSMDKTLMVPFLSSYPYIPTPTAGASDDRAVNYGMPTLKLVVVNPVTAGASSTIVPSVICNIFAAVGDDFRLFLPRGLDSNFTTFTQPSFNQINLSTLFAGEFETLGEKGTEVKIPEYNFGEEFVDIKDLFCRYAQEGSTFKNQKTFTRALPQYYRTLYRFTRYGMRYKMFPFVGLYSAYYQNARYPGTYTHAPYEALSSDAAPVLQVEMPYYEAWYFDLPGTIPSTQTVLGKQSDSTTDLVVLSSVSADSVFSFWTFAVHWAASP